MATLYIEEWGSARWDDRANIDVPYQLVSRTQLTVTSTTARTTFDFDKKTRYIIIYPDIAMMVLLGDSTVEADSNSCIAPAGVFRVLGVDGNTPRLAAILK